MPISKYSEADQKMRKAMIDKYGESRGTKIWYATMNKRKKKSKGR